MHSVKEISTHTHREREREREEREIFFFFWRERDGRVCSSRVVFVISFFMRACRKYNVVVARRERKRREREKERARENNKGFQLFPLVLLKRRGWENRGGAYLFIISLYDVIYTNTSKLSKRE